MTLRMVTGKRRLYALVIVCFLLSTIVSLASLYVMGQNNVREMSRVLATQIYDHIVSELSEPITVSKTMANNSFLVNMFKREQEQGRESVEADIAQYLTGLERGMGYEGAFAISDATGNYYTSAGCTRTIDRTSSHDSWYDALMQSSDDYDVDVDNDEIDAKHLTVYVNAKVPGEDRRPLGVCGVGVRMTGIQDLFQMLEQDFDVTINLVDPAGLVQVATDGQSIERESLPNLVGEREATSYVYRELPNGGFAVTKYIESLDWFLVVQSDGQRYGGQFANVILLNTVLCAIVLFVMLLAMRYGRRREEMLRKASLADELTGLLNRRAFEEDKLAMQQGRTPADLVCVAVDVNGLKGVNDTLGHAAGDNLIRGAATCLRECIGPYGNVYRTGGDEFFALLRMSPDDESALYDRMSTAASEQDVSEGVRLTMSCGLVSRREFPEESVSELCRIADKRMYDDKVRYYERTGATRRKA